MECRPERVLAGAAALPRVELPRDSSSITTLAQATKLPGVQKIQALFADTGLAPRAGFNVGTGALSFTLTVPPQPGMQTASCDAPDHPTEMTKEKLTGDGAATEHPLQTNTHIPYANLIWAMLGVHPHQRALEKAYPEEANGCVEDPASAYKPWEVPEPAFANRCLQLFTAHTGLTMVSRNMNHAAATLQLIIAADRSRSKQEPIPFRFGPCYLQLEGRDPATGALSREVYSQQQQELLSSALSAMWGLLKKLNYVVHHNLQEALTEGLQPYLKAGMRDVGVGFEPGRTKLGLYLHGPPGIGKSEFIKIFSKAFTTLLQQHFHPTIQVVVVKLPLNSVTVSDLKNIAQVRGISDMSIERMIEQSLTKGNVVVFHMEECPEDEAFQAELYEASQKIVVALAKRYPDKVGNIINLITSNHPPAPVIANRLKVVLMEKPTVQQQHVWCIHTLQMRLESVFCSEGATLAVNQKWIDPPPTLRDMRQLYWWTTTFAFHAIALCRQACGAASAPSTLDLQVASVAETEYDLTVQCNGGPPLQMKVHFSPEQVLCLSGADMGQEHAHLTQQGVPSNEHVRLHTVLQMWKANFLQPTVITIMGSPETRRMYRDAIMTLARADVRADGEGDFVLREEELTLTTEADKEKVIGNAADIRGGLFRFVDDVNNPNNTKGETRHGLIVAHANETGQFMLRELLESGVSNTHRLAMHKDRLLFLMDLEPDTALTPQLQSRSVALFGAP